jgi:hypothetical protein
MGNMLPTPGKYSDYHVKRIVTVPLETIRSAAIANPI